MGSLVLSRPVIQHKPVLTVGDVLQVLVRHWITYQHRYMFPVFGETLQ